jgi:NAD(P)-dependent dehydrogenase (short-subunit alcohol dehydrogenase family)
MNKVAVVTGGTSGIGERTVERLLGEGWTVWSLGRSKQKLDEQAARLAADGALHTQLCDVADPASIAAAFEAIGAVTDSIDALILSAGANIAGSMEEMTPEQADLLIGVNMTGPWLCTRAALALLRRNASTDDPARVIVLGSIGGMRPKAGAGMYSATKAAVHVLTGIMAVELAPSGITVNSVAPGTTQTPMIEEMQKMASGKSGFGLSGASPLGRIGTTDDVVDVIGFFLSDAAKYVNGALLPVDGGTRAAFVKS